MIKIELDVVTLVFCLVPGYMDVDPQTEQGDSQGGIREEYFTVFSDAASCCVPDLGLLRELKNEGLIDHNTALQIELAFQEAFANSLEHGNLELESAWKDEYCAEGKDRYSQIKAQRLAEQSYARRRLEIYASFDGKVFLVRIKDEGSGFIENKSGTKSSDDLPCHGRGIPLMKANVDRVTYSERGRVITLTKTVSCDKGGR